MDYTVAVVGIGEWGLKAYVNNLAKFASTPFVDQLAIWLFDCDLALAPPGAKATGIGHVFGIESFKVVPGCGNVWHGVSRNLLTGTNAKGNTRALNVYLVLGTGPREPARKPPYKLPYRPPPGDYVKAGMPLKGFDAVFITTGPDEHIPCARGWRPYSK